MTVRTGPYSWVATQGASASSATQVLKHEQGEEILVVLLTR
jgi:hypothetical protein